jgi:TonB-linked SusC/RagA family outer membrane protein
MRVNFTQRLTLQTGRLVRHSLMLAVVMVMAALQTAYAQNVVSGKVTSTESGEPLPGVNVILKGTTTGTVTNVNGEYRLSVPEDAEILVFSFIGLEMKELAINGRSTINVTMAEDAQQLEELVVTGYQSKSKERSVMAEQTVTAKSIENRPNANFAQTLQGQVAGLNITTTNGQPGGNTTINLRGVSSINGNTEPLFVIDGTPVDEDNFRALNPNEIESVTVLKDASATAIYGNRGANGVVVITTKSGSYDEGLKINYTGQLNLTYLQGEDYDLMNTQEQLRLERQQNRGRGAQIGDGLTDAEFENAIAEEPFTNWYDYFFDAGISQIHNLTISTGKENIRSFTSLGYTDQDGVLERSRLTRYNLRNNINGQSENGKLQYSLNTSINYAETNEPNAIGGSGINQNPVLGAYQSVPYITPDDYVDGRSLLSPLSFANTPLFIMDLLRTLTFDQKEIKMIGSANVNYEIVEGLSANVRVGADFTDQQEVYTRAPNSFNALLFATGGRDNNLTPGFEDQNSDRTLTYNIISSLNYEKEFGEHTLNLGAFTETFRANRNTFGFRNNGLDPKTFSPGDGSSYVDDNADNDWYANTVFANIQRAGLFSYFGSADYDYANRYGLNVTVRRDASYRFSETNRWGTFYSVGGRWNLHNEDFMSNSVFDVLKLRASYGVTGNQRIVNASGVAGYFAAPDLYQDFYATGGGYAGQNAIFLSQIGNSTLRWEELEQSNIGLDMELFNSRLRATVDAYVRTTNDLFQNRPISAINAQTALRANIGSLQNRGIDWTLAYDVFSSTDGFNLTLSTVGNYNKQEVLEIPTPDNQVVDNSIFGLREGGIINEYYVYRYAGVNPDNGNLQFLTADGEVTENPDVDNDRVWLGKNIYPDVQGGFTLNMDYKGIFLTTQWNYTLGAYRFDFDYSVFMDPTSIGQFRHSRDILDAWTPENTNTNVPSLDANNVALSGGSDRFLFDNDYFRLRFITLGYSLPERILNNVDFLHAARVFVNAENLVTFTQWRGFDAEALSPSGSRLYPSPRIISFGLELGL